MAQEIVTIRPKKNSKRFRTANGHISQIHQVQEGEKSVEKNVGDFKGERFPNSRQMFRPKWSASKNMWKLAEFTDMSPATQKELNKLVTACKLKYPKGNPNEGKYITTADLYDIADPFFTHKDLKVIGNEGEVLLNKNRPIDKLIFLALSSDSQFTTGGEKINPIMSSRVRYVITDKTIDTKMKKEIRGDKMKAIKLLDNLTDSKKLRIAVALGAVSNDNVDRDLVDELLFEWAEDNTGKVSNTMTRQQFFIHMCETNNEEIEIRNLISKAKSSGVLKKQRNSGWMLFGQSVARNEKQLLEYLSSDENQDIINRIEQALNDKNN